MMQRRALKGAALAGLVLSAVACQELQVDNPNQPDRDRALSRPVDVESLIASSFVVYFQGLHQTQARSGLFPAMGNETITTSAVIAAHENSTVPRAQLRNQSFLSAATDPTGPAGAWRQYHEVVASANDGIAAINAGLEIGNAVNTQRAKAFAKFMQGLGYAQLGLGWDRATVLNETHDLGGNVHQLVLENIRPYPEVLGAAITSLDEAITIAQQNSFTIPGQWTRGRDLNSAEFIRVANSYAAKTMVYGARTPQERAALNWGEVLRRSENGVNRDFIVTLSTDAGGLFSEYWRRLHDSFAGCLLCPRLHHDVYGPADQSGAWQTYRARVDGGNIAQATRFNVVTPDRRVTGPTPTSSGSYFRYLADNNGFLSARGLYKFSAYQWFRSGGDYQRGTVQLLGITENNLIRAEALLRLGRLDEAAQFINISRTAPQSIAGVTYPGLPPVTAAGAPMVEGACVPRKVNGACGDLMDALIYERRVELIGVDNMRAMVDNRGFGLLPEGALIHLPIPGIELETLRQPYYTYGGVGTNCTVGSACTVPELSR